MSSPNANMIKLLIHSEEYLRVCTVELTDQSLIEVVCPVRDAKCEMRTSSSNFWRGWKSKSSKARIGRSAPLRR